MRESATIMINTQVIQCSMNFLLKNWELTYVYSMRCFIVHVVIVRHRHKLVRMMRIIELTFRVQVYVNYYGTDFYHRRKSSVQNQRGLRCKVCNRKELTTMAKQYYQSVKQ